METDPTNIDQSGGHIVFSDDQNIGHIKAYTCTFCKRGFSNAQALGGHMNIHRKDRAKLKESSSENLLSENITKKKNTSDSPPVSADENSLQPESGEDKSFTPRRSLNSDKEDDDVVDRAKHDTGAPVQLPLFAETPWTTNDPEASSSVGGNVQKSTQLSHSSSPTELDLELRLGPEPRHSPDINKGQ
ncbi:unnamed protein product [Ilex paraguariensis]|uniref:C2H2-type domain-containing protein n=1 Tax=Ilex paraguariensis TaxID=185542 RepID=A0ABC8UW93_9AQUA